MKKVRHIPNGKADGWCTRCGLPNELHVSKESIERDRARSRERDKTRPSSRRSKKPRERYYVGVDGEGHDVCARCGNIWEPDKTVCACGSKDVGHAYTYLAAVAEDGRIVSETPYEPAGLTHEQCVQMILGIPKRATCFAFMFSYDVTKIIEGMPREDRFYLMRPDARRRYYCNTKDCGGKWVNKKRRFCIKCKQSNFQTRTIKRGYRGRGYDFFAGSLSISEKRGKKGWEGTRKIWDVFKYFQSSFVEALKAWKIGTEAQVERIADMKGKRGSFQIEEPENVMAYCRQECELLAVMMRKVLTACVEAGAEQNKGYFGAGSIASALLRGNGVEKFKGPKYEDKALVHAIMCAYFGGRFENSILGIVDGPVYGKDIASAYPYALSTMPCMACGRWSKFRSVSIQDVQRATLALCKFRVHPSEKREDIAWMPLPYRDERRSICYPTNFTGWAWKEEFLSAYIGWPALVELLGAYFYETDCDHRPFGFLPRAYRKRTEWGKDGPGIVMKLGINATYGKTAQRVGDAPKFQDWVWAGNCTSRTRAQNNEGIALARDPWNVLAVATDGIYSLEDLSLPTPHDTGTFDLAKPLGTWESKKIDEGAFFAKPGLYWRLKTTKSEIRARGLGRREAYEQKDSIEAGWLAWDRKDYDYGVRVHSRRFFGAKTALKGWARCSKCGKGWPGTIEDGCPSCEQMGDQWEILEQQKDKENVYGKWRICPIDIKFDPWPKRMRELDTNEAWTRLRVRDVGGLASYSYGGQTSPEGLEAREAAEIELEQPDGEYIPEEEDRGTQE